jgi:hypothetical protein
LVRRLDELRARIDAVQSRPRALLMRSRA